MVLGKDKIILFLTDYNLYCGDLEYLAHFFNMYPLWDTAFLKSNFLPLIFTS